LQQSHLFVSPAVVDKDEEVLALALAAAIELVENSDDETNESGTALFSFSLDGVLVAVAELLLLATLDGGSEVENSDDTIAGIGVPEGGGIAVLEGTGEAFVLAFAPCSRSSGGIENDDSFFTLALRLVAAASPQYQSPIFQLLPLSSKSKTSPSPWVLLSLYVA